MRDGADLRITRASIASAKRIATLQAAAFAEAWGDGFVTSLMHLPGTVAYIAETDDGLLGFVLARAIGGEAEIISIAVDKLARGQGVGGTLLGHALAAAAAAGAREIHLEVAVANVAALALYAQAGFKESGIRRRYYADGSDALVLRRRLMSD